MINLMKKLMKYRIRMSMEPSEVIPGYINVHLRTLVHGSRKSIDIGHLDLYRGDEDYILITKLNEIVDEFIAMEKIYNTPSNENKNIMAHVPSISEMREKYGDDILQVKATSTDEVVDKWRGEFQTIMKASRMAFYGEDRRA